MRLPPCLPPPPPPPPQWLSTSLSLCVSLASCAHGARTQSAAGHAARLRCAAGVPGGGLPLARLLLAEGRTHLQWLLQHLHGQPGDGFTRSRDAARWVSTETEAEQSKAKPTHSPSPSLCPLLSPKYGITEKRDGYRGVMLLVVRSFSASDVGTYHCVSTNSLGRAEGTLRLYGAYA